MSTLSEEFQKHDDNREILTNILGYPVFQQAIAALKEELEALPGDASELNPTLAAAKYQQLIGVNYLLRGLKILAAPAPVKPKGPPPKRMPESLDDLKE